MSKTPGGRRVKEMTGIISLAVLAAAHQDVSILRPASPPTHSINNLFVLVLAITGVIFLIVEGILFYSVVRFRRRPATNANEPPQVYGSMPVEIAWTAAPALVVFVLILVIVRTELEVTRKPPAPAAGDNTLFVTVVGRQWWWEYTYDHFDGQPLGFTTANELHIPQTTDGEPRPVYLTLKSADVCHSFWVPRLAGKTDLIPGRTNTMWFQTAHPGLFVGQCAEYCGTQHAHMLLRVYVDPPDVFRQWLANQQKPAVDAPAARAGRDLFLSQSCINCHRIRGTPAEGTYAPDLTHLHSRETLASGMIPNARTELHDWVMNPQKIKGGCLMPGFGLNDRQVDGIVDYLLTLD
jgi:cytochrome c oxidase subunit II